MGWLRLSSKTVFPPLDFLLELLTRVSTVLSKAHDDGIAVTPDAGEIVL
jgi:hypothetical protein